MNNFSKILLSLALALGLVACGKTETSEAFDVDFKVPAEMSILSTDTEISFSILFNKAPKTSDVIVLTDGVGKAHDCKIKEVQSKKFYVTLYSGITSGTYDVAIKRGSEKLAKGTMELTVTHVVEGGGDVKPESGATIYGIVVCDSKPVSGAVISDGELVVKTGSDGIYQLHSTKKYGYVFISVPGGYEVPQTGVIPNFWKSVKTGSMVPDRVDFELTKVDNDNFTLYVMGDMHLANRNGDIGQFRTLMSDWQTTISSTTGKQYGLTLGDMTWDAYWYCNSFQFANYIAEINKDISGITLLHTMGNHDNDYRQAGDFDKENAYRSALCPTFYSYNIGRYHVVVLDNIDYTNGPASSDNASGTITEDHRSEYVLDYSKAQMDWLKKDLAYVDKTTPLIITSHGPTFSPNGATTFANRFSASNTGSYGTADFVNLLSAYKTHFFSGHTHNMFGYEKSANYYETNCGSACGSWWWSGKVTPGINIACDGTPGGYMVVKVNGTNMTWQYKSGGYDISHQFRSYDMNNVKAVVTNAYGNNQEKWKTYVSAMQAFEDNTVLINLWDYDLSWKVEVTENGKPLTVTPMRTYDPLHLIALTGKRFQSTSSPNFTANLWCHFFLVKASSATSTLEIKVTDRFGNVYTESMARPKEFSTNNYLK